MSAQITNKLLKVDTELVQKSLLEIHSELPSNLQSEIEDRVRSIEAGIILTRRVGGQSQRLRDVVVCLARVSRSRLFQCLAM